MRTGALLVIFFLGVGAAIDACAEPSVPEHKLPAYCFEEKAFTAELVKCVTDTGSREEMKPCRTEVHRRCGKVEP